VSVPTAAGALCKLEQSSLHEPEKKEVPVPTAAGTLIKLEQSSLHEPENKEVSDPTAAGTLIKLEQSSLHEPEKKEVPVPTAAGTLGKLEQSSLHEPENKEVSVPTAAGTLIKLEQSSLHEPENKGVCYRLKSFFGVRKTVSKFKKISVTPEEFLKKSMKVSEMKLHQRKIAPVIIWDFGGQDVFYSTHQTFLTYRAIYMLILDGSRTLDGLCSSKKYMPGKGGARTQRGNSFVYKCCFFYYNMTT
jgi:hypothetical protein